MADHEDRTRQSDENLIDLSERVDKSLDSFELATPTPVYEPVVYDVADQPSEASAGGSEPTDYDG